MKKVISFALALVMLLSLSIAVNAETYEAPGTYTADVKASYVEGIEAGGTTYSITIEWSGMDSFVYNAAKNPVWDPENLEYSETIPANWEGSGAITIKNRSNTTLAASVWYEPTDGYEDAHIVFDKIGAIVADASATKQEESVSFTATAIGALPECEDSTTIGQITLTIDDCALLPNYTESEVENKMVAASTTMDIYQSEGKVVTTPENVADGSEYVIFNEYTGLREAIYPLVAYNPANIPQLEVNGIYTYCVRYLNAIVRTK